MALALSLFLNKLNPNSTKWYRLKEPSGSSSESEWEAYRFSVGQLMLCLYPEMLKKQRGEGEATPSATPQHEDVSSSAYRRPSLYCYLVQNDAG